MARRRVVQNNLFPTTNDLPIGERPDPVAMHQEAVVNTFTTAPARSHFREILSVILSALLINACATRDVITIPGEGYAIEGIVEGDRVEITMLDDTKQRFTVTRVSNVGLEGDVQTVAYADMRSVKKLRDYSTLNTLLIGLAVLGLLAWSLTYEPEPMWDCLLFCDD